MDTLDVLVSGKSAIYFELVHADNVLFRSIDSIPVRKRTSIHKSG